MYKRQLVYLVAIAVALVSAPASLLVQAGITVFYIVDQLRVDDATDGPEPV